jgi:NAD-dependent dihydropyrimidine dehydrogenase PreA subunit
MAEAQRCLHCWVNTVFEGNVDDGSLCILCGGCVDVCPENCLELVTLDRVAFSSETLEHLSVNSALYEAELPDITVEELTQGVGSVMIKDETRCIRCGLCAARCPVKTISMESYNLLPAEPTGLISVEAIDAPLRAQPAPRAGA